MAFSNADKVYHLKGADIDTEGMTEKVIDQLFQKLLDKVK